LRLVKVHGLSKREREELEKRIGEFMRIYGRRAQKGCEPNDRRFDVRVEQYVRKMRPEDLDVLLNGHIDEEESSREQMGSTQDHL